MKTLQFDKKATQVAKGVAISLMLFHHLFIDSTLLEQYGVVFPLIGRQAGTVLGQLTKICIFMFIFLSAYGIARSTAALRGGGLPKSQVNRRLTAYSVKRYIAIMAGYLWVYVLVYIFAWAARGSAIPAPDPVALYGTGVSGFCYTLIDALGLAFLLRGPFLVNEWWFWSIAILIVFVMPAFLRWFERNGVACCVVAALLANWLYMLDREGLGHLTALPLGIACAEQNWFERLRKLGPIKGGGHAANLGNAALRLGLAGAVFLLGMAFAATGISFYLGYQYAALALIYLCWQLLGGLPAVAPALAFLGKHSMNIFLTHTVALRAFPQFFFGARYAPLCWALLMAVSLALSLLMEAAKRLVRYNKLEAWLKERTDRWVTKVAVPAKSELTE